MALVLKDRVKESTATTGTGTLTLAGADFGFQSFSVVGNSNTTYYAIYDPHTGDWEVGLGTYTASGTTLSRDTVLESSNSNGLVDFASGSKEVFVTYPAEKSVIQDATGKVTFGDSVVVEGDLTVNGTTTTVNAENLAVADNMIYLNAGSSVTNPDLGIAGNYNDGTYAHAGVFRDATDGRWKVFDGYIPEPDTSPNIDTGHASFALADFQADTFYGALSGNATTASALETARSIGLTGDVSGSASFDGSANITITAAVADDSHDHIIGNVDGLQTALDAKAPLASPALTGTPTAPTAATGTSTTQVATTEFVNAEIANDAPTKTGGGASGTWDISVTGSSGSTTGNAATATTLQTARTINGVSFNGSANITVEPYISDDDTGDTNCPIIFSADTTAGYKRLYEDSALYFNNTSNILYSTTFSGALSGNATTATTLQTARTINGVSFDGSANITVADSTKLPLAGGTATGTITAPTFNATSTTSGGFQGIDADSETNPSFTWTADLDTGMYRKTSNQIGFTTGGTLRATINSTGVAVVGTVTSDTFNATSATNGGFQGIDADTITAPSFTWTADLDTGMWHAGTNQIGFTTAGTNQMTITTTGVTAVGTVTGDTFNATSATNGGFQGIDTDSATNPSFTWSADLNTGMYRDTTDRIGFTAGGNNEFLIYTTYTLSPGSSRAPLFYDSNDTAYYANPAGTSIFNVVRATTLQDSSASTIYAAKAWASFESNGTLSILDSGGVSSITDNGVGDFTANFSSAFPNANYAVVTSSNSNNAANNVTLCVKSILATPSNTSQSKLTTSVRLQCALANESTRADNSGLYFACFTG